MKYQPKKEFYYGSIRIAKGKKTIIIVNNLEIELDSLEDADILKYIDFEEGKLKLGSEKILMSFIKNHFL